MTPCIEWWGTRDSHGYGVLKRGGKQVKAHRMIYTECFGDPGELWVLHHCDNPPCVNPEHLFLGTAVDNVQDMMSKGRQRFIGAPTHDVCKHGHEFTPENTRYSPRSDRDYPMKVCITCATERNRRHRQKSPVK